MQEKEQKISPIKKRILLFAENLGISKREFYKNIGVSRGTLESSSGITEDIMAKFIAAFPDINSDWLLTGKGEMLKETSNKRAYGYVRSENKVTERHVEYQCIPLYDLRAAAGLSTLFTGNENIVDKIQVPNLSNVDGAIFITGDSMYPLLKSGDIVIYKEVHNIEYLNYGDVYILSYQINGDEHVVVKYVNVSEKNGFIKLVSYNSHYAPLDIPLSSIRKIALVKASIRYNTMY